MHHSSHISLELSTLPLLKSCALCTQPSVCSLIGIEYFYWENPWLCISSERIRKKAERRGNMGEIIRFSSAATKMAMPPSATNPHTPNFVRCLSYPGRYTTSLQNNFEKVTPGTFAGVTVQSFLLHFWLLFV